MRKRKEEEERLAQQAEFLNRSLRESKKLQALERRPQGVVNDGYSSEEQDLSRESRVSDKEVVYTAYGK